MTAEPRSFCRFFADALAYRVRRLLDVGDTERLRSITLRGGSELTYRLNRGDVRAIGETWIAQGYKLPIELEVRNVLDLGANIGATSVWLAHRYGARRVIAVEPAPGNAELARINLRRNRIEGEVVEAAVGPRTTTALFELSETSTWGLLGENGIEVTVASPQSLVDRFPAGELIDLVKMDVEGAEGELLTGETGWLEHVRCVVAELHTDRVDSDALIASMQRQGFNHCRLGEGNLYLGAIDLMIAFWRPEVTR